MKKFRRARLGYFLFCVILAAVAYYAVRKYAPPEMWDALRSTYLQQETEEGS